MSYQAPVVQKGDSAIRWIKQYPMDKAIGFPTTYPLDSDLSRGWRKHYPAFEQLGQVDSTIRQNRAGDFTLSFYSCDRV